MLFKSLEEKQVLFIKQKPKVGVRSLHAKSLQLCPTLCDPTDYSLTGISVHGILQASVLEWVAAPFSRGSSRPRY